MDHSLSSKQRFVEDFGGKGDVLVLVHGLGGTTNTWFPQSQVIRRDVRAVAYDLAGSGRSPSRSGLSIESHVSDLAQVIESLSSERPVHLAGHSMGTIICQHFAAAHPDKVTSLVLVGGFTEPPQAARKALRERAAKARGEGIESIADAIVTAGTSADTKSNNPAAAAFVRQSILSQTAEGYAANCEALSEATAADLAKIKCPVLLLTGDEDKTAPPDVARAMATQLTSREPQILAGCGHWATVERAKQVNYAMTVFYARQRQELASA